MNSEWKKGFPKYTLGFSGYYLFEALLSDLFENGKVVEVYVKDDQWYKNSDGKLIPVEQIVGWRESYDCHTARIAIDDYVRKCGYGCAVKDNFVNA